MPNRASGSISSNFFVCIQDIVRGFPPQTFRVEISTFTYIISSTFDLQSSQYCTYFYYYIFLRFLFLLLLFFYTGLTADHMNLTGNFDGCSQLNSPYYSVSIQLQTL